MAILSPPLLPFNIGIGPRPNVLTAAQAKNRRERYNVRGGLVRETGLEPHDTSLKPLDL